MMAVLSGNLANDVVVEILSRIPVKSVTRFNCVSKSWRELIRSPYFITKHLKKDQAAIRNHSFVFSGKDSISLLHRYDLKLKGDCLKICPPPPIKKEELRRIIIRAIGDGIIYFHALIGFHTNDFLWNPATRKLKAVPQFHRPYHPAYFGVCFCSDSNSNSNSNGVKVVRLPYGYQHDDCKEKQKKAEIWSIVDNSQSWREIDVNVHEDLGSQLIGAGQLYIGGTCYWVGRSRESIGGGGGGGGGGLCYYRFLVSFDMVKERFDRISLPGRLGASRVSSLDMVMAELKQSLAIISTVPNENHGVEVWLMMNNKDDKGSSSCWSKYYSLKAPLDVVSHGRWLYPLELCKDAGCGRRLYPLGSCKDTEELIMCCESSHLYFHDMKTNKTVASCMLEVGFNNYLYLYPYEESLVPLLA